MAESIGKLNHCACFIINFLIRSHFLYSLGMLLICFFLFYTVYHFSSGHESYSIFKVRSASVNAVRIYWDVNRRY
jgi:hypothetical protein